MRTSFLLFISLCFFVFSCGNSPEKRTDTIVDTSHSKTPRHEVMRPTRDSDSARLAAVIHEFLRICRSVDFADPKVQELGPFYKAAPYIAYMGDDESRKWKDVADYTKPEERIQVDDICSKINNTVNQDSNYKFIGYRIEHESEGTWHAMTISHKKKGENKRTALAFLKIGDRFILGDID